MKNDWLDQVRNRLQAEAAAESGVPFDRLRAEGMIDDRGEVTGRLHRWDSFLAVTEVKRAADARRIESFRCLKPVFGMPGGATIDISRDSMVAYLKEGKKVVTALRNERLGLWTEVCDVRLSSGGFVLGGAAGDGEDNIGCLPEFRQSTSRF